MDRRYSESLIEYVEQKITLKSPDYGYDMLEKLNQMRTQAVLTDILLCVGQEEFPCHRNVLAVSSPYFQAMFSSDLRESKENKICFSDVSPWIMRRVIEYAYTGCVEISVDNAQEMLAAANLFQYPNIVKACCDFLRQHLQPSNCLGIEHFAHLHDCFVLETDAHKFTLDNFSSVVEQDEFLDLSLPSLLSYLASDLIDVRTEETVYVAAMNWIRQNTESRSHYIHEVLKEVRLATIDLVYLKTVIKNDPLILKNEECRALVEDACKNHVSLTQKHGQRRRSVQEVTIQPRPSTVAKEVLVVVGGTSNSVLTSVEMYEPIKDKWTFLPELPCILSCQSVCAFHNDIYVTGGICEGKLLDTVWRFESAKRKWRKSSSLKKPRARHTSAVSKSTLYVLGGETTGKGGNLIPVEEIECLTVETGQWTFVGESPFPRKYSKLVPYRGCMLEIGGCQTSGPSKLRAVDTYVCQEGKLKHSGEQFILPDFIEHAQMAELDGILYIIWEDERKVITLDPEKRTFKHLEDMKHTHLHSGATVVNDKIYITGGTDQNKATRVVECYDPVSYSWSVVKPLRHSRSHHGCVMIYMS